MSWIIETDDQGRTLIRHLGAPGFMAFWTAGAFPDEAGDGPVWTDEGSGEDDTIHLYGFVWERGAPEQDVFEELIRKATTSIDVWITERG